MGSENGGQLDLRIIAHIPLDIEFYNEASDELTKGAVAICFGCISFRDRTPGALRKAYVSIITFSYPTYLSFP
jgi:hypothetical protein